jgi:hypothetical protein
MPADSRTIGAWITDGAETMTERNEDAALIAAATLLQAAATAIPGHQKMLGGLKVSANDLHTDPVGALLKVRDAILARMEGPSIHDDPRASS